VPRGRPGRGSFSNMSVALPLLPGLLGYALEMRRPSRTGTAESRALGLLASLMQWIILSLRTSLIEL